MSLTHLRLGCLVGLLQEAQGVSDVWRLLCLQPPGSFAPICLTVDAVRQRLLRAKLPPLELLFERVNAALLSREPLPPATTLAPFATEIMALDDSTLDAVKRLCDDTKTIAPGSPRLKAGKLVRLFDLRRQQWKQMYFLLTETDGSAD